MRWWEGHRSPRLDAVWLSDTYTLTVAEIWFWWGGGGPGERNQGEPRGAVGGEKDCRSSEAEKRGLGVSFACPLVTP